LAEAIVGRAEGSVDGLQHPSADLSQLFKSIEDGHDGEEIVTQWRHVTRAQGNAAHEIVASEPKAVPGAGG
jgi:hypothetical protein